MRLIDADALKARVMPKCQFPTAFELQVDQEPTAYTVRHGHWIPDCHCNKFDGYACSVCERWIPSMPDRNYCPRCGAKMDEVSE